MPSIEKEPWNKRWDRTTDHFVRLERSLLFLTATSAVCQLASQKWYSPCVFMLTILASGDLGIRAEEDEGVTAAGDRSGTLQEEHLLEAYDCDDPEEVTLHSTREQNDWERQVENGEVKITWS